MTRLSPFTVRLTDGQEATFFASTHPQALELAITWSRARGLLGLPSDHEKDRVAWDLPSPRHWESGNDVQPARLAQSRRELERVEFLLQGRVLLQGRTDPGLPVARSVCGHASRDPGVTGSPCLSERGGPLNERLSAAPTRRQPTVCCPCAGDGRGSVLIALEWRARAERRTVSLNGGRVRREDG
jgi:hypothetical protein